MGRQRALGGDRQPPRVDRHVQRGHAPGPVGQPGGAVAVQVDNVGPGASQVVEGPEHARVEDRPAIDGQPGEVQIAEDGGPGEQGEGAKIGRDDRGRGDPNDRAARAPRS